MTTSEKELTHKYRDLILEQIREELNTNQEQLQKIIETLNNFSSDELETTYETFERFGDKVTIKTVKEIC